VFEKCSNKIKINTSDKNLNKIKMQKTHTRLLSITLKTNMKQTTVYNRFVYS